VLTRTECEQLIELARPRVGESGVYVQGGSQVNNESRDSQVGWLEPTDHPLLQKLSGVAVALSGRPSNHQEKIQVACYRADGYYKAHYDACDGNAEFCRAFVAMGGQRLATLLVYLNDNFVGGETHFPQLQQTVQPRRGSGVFFWNTNEEDQCIIRESLHSGLPVHEGEKWILNVWVRHQPVHLEE
jgi:prolyl 4-hydroxylase